MSGTKVLLIIALVSAMCGYGMWVFLKDADSTKLKVTAGMEHIDALPKGEPPRAPGKIVTARAV